MSKVVGIVAPAGGVAVGRGGHRHHERAGLDGAAADLERRHRDAPGHLHRGVEPQALLDRVGDEGRVVAEPGELVGVAQQLQRAVADEVDRGLVAGDEQQAQLVEQLARR